jgi:hypothetical protein
MLELNPYRKNKVNLQDYDYQKDIQNRLLMAELDANDLLVLEEILLGHPKLSVSQLAQDLLLEELDVVKILTKLSSSGLFTIKDHFIILNKEMRKYFEAQLQKFEEDFVPGMEYLQSLLRKVPMHNLITWYPIPRTSNNIFESLVEKYLLTPQIFQRYLLELQFSNPKASSIIEDVFNSTELEIPSSFLKSKYKLSNEEFEEILLHLEFNFVCCIVYRKIENKWIEVVTPFFEWREYLTFLKTTKTSPVEEEDRVAHYRASEFSFVEDMSELLKIVKTAPIALQLSEKELWIPDKTLLKTLSKKIPPLSSEIEHETYTDYLAKIIQKLLFLNLCKVEASSLKPYESTEEWLSLSIENRALAIYKHTISKIHSLDFPQEIATERNVKEIEKSLIPVMHLGWVKFSDFIKSVTATVSKESKVTLKKQGRTWKYALPSYTADEIILIKTTLLEWLFEAGFVSLGFIDGEECFRVTSFGQSIFS